MRITSFLSTVAICLCLTGCIPEYQTTYQYVPPHSRHGISCINRCLQNQSYCNSRCAAQGLTCHADANHAAKPAFKEYIKNQRKNNMPLDKNISDFADYSSCDNTCGCANDYRQCYANCGGQVIPHTKCVAFCKKPT